MKDKIHRYRGNTKRLSYCVEDEQRQPIDITGWSFTLTIDREENPSDTSTQLESINAIINDAEEGCFYFPMSETADIEPGDYFYDIKAIDNNAETETLRKGEITFEQDISK